MNKAITDGLALMPTPFSAGLNVWSSGDGRPGTPTYDGASNAAFVPADADFGGCLELVKTASTQLVRYMVQTPLLPGMYLQVKFRIKALAGNLPTVAVSALPLNAASNPVGGLAQTAPGTVLSTYGDVVTVRAIIGSGNRGGVNLVWGTGPVAAHIGLTLSGPNGGTVRIDDIEVEDVTSYFLRDFLDVVDVRDLGAVGDGTTDDRAAFQAADAEALLRGSTVLVPEGNYRIVGNLTMSAQVRFQGRVIMNAADRLALTRNYDIETYTAAFGDEPEAFRRALQALFAFTDHGVLDLRGRRVDITAPIDVAALAGLTGANFAVRRVINNGQLNVVDGSGWAPATVTSQASYDTGAPYLLSNVVNVANIEVGALVTGTGVARETYVRSKNVAAGTVELSLPPGYTAGTRTYTFTRFRYMLDFGGFGRLDRFEFDSLELLCNGVASAIMLPPSGITTRVHGCVFVRPRDRAITSIGTGCQGLMIDECQFLSNEQAEIVQDRTTIALNVNANDVKLRDNRIVRFRHFAVMHGTGHMFIGNHWFQGDSAGPGVRTAGVVMTGINLKTLITGNYIDNSFIELTNERELNPAFESQFSFGGLTVTGNIFTVNNSVPSFSWLVITPHGPGHFIQGLSVTGNTFRTLNVTLTRCEKVDTTFANLDYSRFRNVVVHGNNFNGISNQMFNPVTVTHDQNTASTVWTVNPSQHLPFAGWARSVTAVVPQGPIMQGSTMRWELPYAEVEQGAANDRINLRWPVAVTGRVRLTARVDSPT